MVGIAIALAATVGFFVVKRHSWLLAAPLSFGLWFSLSLAVIEGWNTQVIAALSAAQVVVVIGAIGLTIAAFVFMGRTLRHLNSVYRNIARDLGEIIANEGLFRDDGERIIIYANRGRVALRALMNIAILTFFAVLGWLAYIVVPDTFSQVVIIVCIAFILSFGGVITLLLLIRVVMTSPTLVVNADGILDNCSMIVTGRGLLRWNETLEVEEFIYSRRWPITYHYLDINVSDRQDINRRQPRWKGALAIFVGYQHSMGYRILRSMLDRPVAALVTEINRYINTHAPEESWHKAWTGDEAELSEEVDEPAQASLPRAARLATATMRYTLEH